MLPMHHPLASVHEIVSENWDQRKTQYLNRTISMVLFYTELFPIMNYSHKVVQVLQHLVQGGAPLPIQFLSFDINRNPEMYLWLSNNRYHRSVSYPPTVASIWILQSNRLQVITQDDMVEDDQFLFSLRYHFRQLGIDTTQIRIDIPMPISEPQQQLDYQSEPQVSCYPPVRQISGPSPEWDLSMFSINEIDGPSGWLRIFQGCV